MKRTTFTAAAALLALAALPGRATADGTPATGTPATGGPATAGPETWQPGGTLLNGAAVTGDAPEMKAGVTYRDTIRPGETRFYAMTPDTGASSAVSAFAVPPPGSRVAYGDGIELKLESADGTECDSQDAHFGADGEARPVGTAVSRIVTGDSGDPCQGRNQYTLQVHRVSDGASDPGAWPLELRYVSEPGLKEGAAPPSAPAVTAGASPTPLTAGTPHQAAGGTSFETAAAIRTGIWKDTVLPGETRFYKVPVDWGQQATVFADFSSAPVRNDSGYVGAGVLLTAYSPVRERIAGDDRGYQGAPVSVSEQLAPVAYGNRTAGDSKVAAVRYAGWYYFAVTVHPDVADSVTGPVPVTLRVDVQGTAQPGPAYDGNARAAGIGVDARDVASANGTAGGGDGHSGPLRFLAFAALGAGTMLLLSLAVWTVGARLTAARTGSAAARRRGYGPTAGW
ncbi:hypothetical protein [Actinacidiphila acidipaludis]|uniref:Uncharacterized protein n=1 Tax=Actinacidiphila acidipaludis TaxID=2873382 RepID=A0ABS7QE18_9ACTN|nr:hypothetical protein [Streptomyces acidipaludis]MBY8881367.1 hypothetical protein [Streptomyces acidipaludis]